MIRVLAGRPASVGRHIENTATLRHISISRRHAQLEVNDGTLLIRDLGSMNGTYVNGQRIEEARVEHQDAVQFGNVRYVVEAEGTAPQSGQEIVRRFSTNPKSYAAVQQSFATSGAELSVTSLKVSDVSQSGSESSRLATLLAIMNTLMGCRDERELGNRILDELQKIIGFDRAALLLLDDGDHLESVVARPEQSGPAVSRIVSETIVREALQRGEGVLTTDASADPRFQQAVSVAEYKVRAAVCFPLMVPEGPIGALYFDNQMQPGVYTEGDLEYLGAFATQAAMAVSHMQLQRRLREEAVVQANFSRFFSPATVDRILGGNTPVTLGGVEQQVTVLFSDLRGFTSLGEALSPMQLAELLNEYFPQMVDIVFAHEGTLEKYIGDGLLAVWGAPVSHGDDAARAVRAAKQMQEGVAELNTWWQKEGRPYHIEIGIGINAGLAFAGNIGSERYLQYATIGDTTNTASRLCDSARGGEILVSQGTVDQITDPNIAFGPPTYLQLRGKREPLAVCNVR